MALAVQAFMATPALARFGSDELKAEFLAPAISGEQVCSVAVSEPGAGSDVAGIRTRASRDGDDWVINGRKMWITNGTQADWICLLARTSQEGGYQGMSLIVVRSNTLLLRGDRTSPMQRRAPSDGCDTTNCAMNERDNTNDTPIGIAPTTSTTQAQALPPI